MEVSILYTVYVYKDQDFAYGLTFPDFEGCFSVADDMQDIQHMAQEAVEVYFDGEDASLPEPSSPEQWAGDERFEGGYWRLVDIDISKVNGVALLSVEAALESLSNKAPRKQGFIALELPTFHDFSSF